MMNIDFKLINNDEDYEEALEKVESLMDAEESSKEADALEVLALLIEKYEDKHYPIEMPSAIDAIKFRMEQADLKQVDLIPLIGTRSRVSEVLSGKVGLSLKMMRNLNKQLNIPAEVLLQEPGANFSDFLSDLDYSKFPIKEMSERNVFQSLSIKTPLENVEKTIQSFINSLGTVFDIPAMQYRKSGTLRLNAKRNPYSLLAWSLHIFSEVSKIECKEKFQKDLINGAFLKRLTSLSVLPFSPLRAKELLEEYGIILIYLPQYKKTYLDGAAFLKSNGTPVIAITGRYNRLDNFWFVLLHELGHVVKHLSDKSPSFTDDMTLRGLSGESDIEREADLFAENALISPSLCFDPLLFNSQEDVKIFSKKSGIHPAIIAGRIQHDRGNYALFHNLIVRGGVRESFEE